MNAIMNTNQLKCPNCGTMIDIDEVLKHQADEILNEKMRVEQEKLERQKREFEEKKKRENDLFIERIEKEKQRICKEEEEKAKKGAEALLKTYQDQLDKKNEEITSVRKKELELINLQNDIKIQRENMELEIQKQLQSKQEELSLKIQKQEQEKTELNLKERDKKIEQLQKLLEEAQRKAAQGSMQLQGEVQEIALEALLKENFPFDLINEVSKGVRGADCIQTVRNNFGQECGKIIYESKRTQNFSQDWIEKLKADMRAQNADIAVLVTQCMPKDMEQFGERNGVWICCFPEVKAVANILRSSILKISALTRSQENKGDKMHLLYDYLTSSEFNEQWKAIREGFLSLKQSIDTERTAMEKLWKAREKQLEKILLNAAHISGSVEGIAGMENIDLKLLDNAD